MARARPAAEFGDLLQEALRRSGKTRAELQAGAEVSKVSVNNWVMGYSWPRLDHAYAIAACLGVSLDELGTPTASSRATERQGSKDDLTQRLMRLGPEVAPALRQLTTAAPDLLQVLEDAGRTDDVAEQ